MPVQILKRPFPVAEYYRMAQAGIFNEDDRVELIEGEIVEMAPIRSPHAASVDRLTQLFSERIGRSAIVRVQSPVRLGLHSGAQPDIALLQPRTDFYASSHPGPQDVILLTTLALTFKFHPHSNSPP